MKTIIVITIILACIGLTYMYPHAMISPGELLQGHSVGNKKCMSCHTAFGGIPNNKCISCHSLADIGKDTLHTTDSAVNKPALLFHQALSGQKCTSCHSDHKGLQPAMPISSFTHELLAANVISNCNNCHNKPTGKLHQPLSVSCNSCHTTKGWKQTVQFDHDMIQGADKNNCISCHQKPNDEFHQLSAGNCNTCHGTTKWLPSTFNHATYFLLDNNHNAKCNTCHTDNTSFKTYTCYGCHEHSEANILNKHNEEGILQISNCVSCHKTGNEHEAERNGDSKSDKQSVNNVKDYINKENNNKEKDDD